MLTKKRRHIGMPISQIVTGSGGVSTAELMVMIKQRDLVVLEQASCA